METSQEHKEITCVNYLNLKQANNVTFFLFSSTKSENKRVEQVLSMVRLVLAGRGMCPCQGKGGRRVNMVQKLCTNVCKCKNDTCWNHSKNGGREEQRRGVERMNSSMIYLIHCKKFCKCHNVPPPSTTINKIRYRKNVPRHYKSHVG
jgi:hypothetical protein